MVVKTTSLAILAIFGVTLGSSSKLFQKICWGISTACLQNNCLDSLPPLHTIKEDDMASITTSFENHVITVNLKNGNTYSYLYPDWDMEEYDSSLNKKLREAINKVKMTFTRVEHPPEFPGGEEAWNKYIRDFCTRNQKAIKEEGSAKLTIQFTVHLKGQVTDIKILANSRDSKLSALAMEAIQDGPRWIPAVQNGYTVVCRTAQLVMLSP